MTTRTPVMLAAGLEVATGVALIVSPTLVVGVLFGVGLSDGGVAVGRVGGFALLSLAIACWPRSDAALPATRALFLFNLLTAVYLGYLRINGTFITYFMLPACIIHAVLALLLARPAYKSDGLIESGQEL
jgi:hypothetical protein